MTQKKTFTDLVKQAKQVNTQPPPDYTTPSDEDLYDDVPPSGEPLYVTYTQEEWIPGTNDSHIITKKLDLPHDPTKYRSLLLICCYHARRRNTAMTLDNYLRCWTQDMAEQLAEAGTPFARLIADVKRRLSSEISSPTTNAMDITSSNSSKQTKTASPTSLF